LRSLSTCSIRNKLYTQIYTHTTLALTSTLDEIIPTKRSLTRVVRWQRISLLPIATAVTYRVCHHTRASWQFPFLAIVVLTVAAFSSSTLIDRLPFVNHYDPSHSAVRPGQYASFIIIAKQSAPYPALTWPRRELVTPAISHAGKRC
jgi:hypothetical protein